MNAIAYPDNYIAPFSIKDFPWQLSPWLDKSPVMVLDGSAGGGKSRLAGEKVHAYCLKYPNSTALILRKTRESMTNSTLLSFQFEVVGHDKRVRHVKSGHRFEYFNGSILAYGGMADEKQRDQIRGIGLAGGLDIVWMEEAVAFREGDYNEILPRMRGRAGGWRQIILSTNPGSPDHWIYKRLIMGKEASRWKSKTSDNPLHDADYYESLNKLTGVQRQRLRDGEWVHAEGLIYDNWSEENVSEDLASYNADLPLFWSIDDGYKNPRVIHLHQIRPNGTHVVIDEYYKREAMPDTSIKEVLAKGYPRPDFAIYDPSAASFAAFLNDQGIQTIPADNNVSEGIKKVRQYIRDGNGVVSLYVHPRCVKLIEEMSSYQWSDSVVIQGGDPKPLKESDHAMDSLRYSIFTSHPYQIPLGGYGEYSG